MSARLDRIVTWSSAHPHASESEWVDDRTGVAWTWALCGSCGAKTAAPKGDTRPRCDECASETVGAILQQRVAS